MQKTALIKLASIQYDGESIGDDIRIEVQTEDNLIFVEKKIPKGSVIQLNKKIAELTTTNSLITLPITMRVIEKDVLFNDVGSAKGMLKIVFNDSTPQKFLYQIKVKESKGFITRRRAVFILALEAESIFGTLRYVGKTKDAWLVGKREDTGEPMSIPMNLMVRLNRVQSKREYCTILEGVLSGIEVSLKLDTNGRTFLIKESPRADPVSLVYSISKKILNLDTVIYKATNSPSAPWKKGLYDIEIPDVPHRGGLNYSEAKYGRTWFRIGHAGERYIHTGRHSLGCITIIEQKRWDGLCEKLLKGRKGDGKSVGTLEVID